MSAAAVPAPWPAVLLIGPTGSGKTPLGGEMERNGFHGRPCLHFDFGAILRALAAGGAGGEGLTPGELAAIRASLDSGALFEDRDLPMIVKILKGFVGGRGLASDGLLVLNGLPRHRGQAEALSDLVAVELVVSLEADAAVIRERILNDAGMDRAGRADDSLEAVAKRLADFRRRTAPLVGFYRERGVPVRSIAVEAEMTASEMYEALAAGGPS